MGAELAGHELDTKRRMPEKLYRYLIKVQGGKAYLPAAYRIVWFRDELGDEWGISTVLLEGGHAAGYATVRAAILNPEGREVASAHKTEDKKDFPAGWVEKAESGAIARALAYLGFGTQFDRSLDDDGSHPADSPQARKQLNRTPLPHEEEPPPPAKTPEEEERGAAIVEFKTTMKNFGYQVTPGCITAKVNDLLGWSENDRKKPTSEEWRAATQKLIDEQIAIENEEDEPPHNLIDVQTTETPRMSAAHA